MASSLPDELGGGHLLRSDRRPREIRKADVGGARLRKAEVLTPARLRAFVRDIEKPAGEAGCWVWRGSVNGTGYASGGGTNNRPMHLVAYEWMVGPIPQGMELDHLCRNRTCVNPHHLEPVTRSENLRRSKQPPSAFEVRQYCRRGHVLDARNMRVWSNGRGKFEIRCYLCHDGQRKPRYGDA